GHPSPPDHRPAGLPSATVFLASEVTRSCATELTLPPRGREVGPSPLGGGGLDQGGGQEGGASYSDHPARGHRRHVRGHFDPGPRSSPPYGRSYSATSRLGALCRQASSKTLWSSAGSTVESRTSTAGYPR